MTTIDTQHILDRVTAIIRDERSKVLKAAEALRNDAAKLRDAGDADSAWFQGALASQRDDEVKRLDTIRVRILAELEAPHADT